MTVLYTATFEDDYIGGTTSGTPCTVSTEQIYAGTKSLKAFLDYDVSSTPYRAEIRPQVSGSNFEFAYDTVYWVGFAVYVPSGYPNSGPDQGDLIWQQHNTPDTGYSWTNPTMSIVIKNDRFYYNTDTDLGAIQKGAWNRFVIQMKLGNSGFAKIWVNDVQGADFTGKIAVDVAHYTPFFKFGLYRWVWKPEHIAIAQHTSDITVYFDAFKVGDASESYDTIDPAGGSAPGAVLPSITSINTTDAIEPSVTVNTALTTGITGALSVTIDDGTDSTTVDAISNEAGSVVLFNTDTLTNINTPCTVTINHATPFARDFNPLDWVETGSAGDLIESSSAYANSTFPDAAEYKVSATGQYFDLARFTAGSVTSGDLIEVYFYFRPGTGGKGLYDVKAITGGQRWTVSGTIGAEAESNTAFGTSRSYTILDSAIYSGWKIAKLTCTANFSDTIDVGMGPNSSVLDDSIHIGGAFVYVNKLIQTASKQVTIPSLVTTNDAPTFSSVGSLTSGSSVAVVGTDLGSIVSAVVDTDKTINDFISTNGTNATFTAPYGLSVGANTLVATWSPSAVFDNDAVNWADNSGGALVKTAYGVNTWAGNSGVRIASGGVNWHRTSGQLCYAQAGDTVTVEIYYLIGSSGNAIFSARNMTSGENYIVAGTFGSYAVTSTQLGSGHTFSDTEVNGLRKMTLTFVNSVDGYINGGIGPYSDIDGTDVIGIAKRGWSDNGLNTVSYSVTVASGLSKKIAFTGDNTLYCRSAAAGNASAYSSAADGDIYIIIGSGNPRPSPGGQFPTILAYATNVTIVNGEYVLDESDLEYGSINALDTGDQGYYMWASNASGSCRWSAPVQVIAE